jgi:hypothetical protein
VSAVFDLCLSRQIPAKCRRGNVVGTGRTLFVAPPSGGLKSRLRRYDERTIDVFCGTPEKIAAPLLWQICQFFDQSPAP